MRILRQLVGKRTCLACLFGGGPASLLRGLLLLKTLTRSVRQGAALKPVTVHVHVAQARADSGVLCDRGYMTATEWRTEGGGFKDRSGGGFKRLPFHCCAIAFTPFEDPVPPRRPWRPALAPCASRADDRALAALANVRLPSALCWRRQACTLDGTTYDITNIVPYIQKFHRHPATGEPLELKDVVKLTFHRNADGEYHCPVLAKVFTEATHIVALRPTGNVFCYEARGPTSPLHLSRLAKVAAACCKALCPITGKHSLLAPNSVIVDSLPLPHAPHGSCTAQVQAYPAFMPVPGVVVVRL